MQSNTTISIDTEILKIAREQNYNISQICEDALRLKTIGLTHTETPEEEYEKAWEEQKIFTMQQEIAEREKAASDAEAECIGLDRNLWNKTYVLFKEKYGENKARDVNNRLQRTEARVAMFKQLKEAEKQKNQETKELLE